MKFLKKISMDFPLMTPLLIKLNVCRLFGSSHGYAPPPPAPTASRGQPVGGAGGPPRGRPNGLELAQNVVAMVQSGKAQPSGPPQAGNNGNNGFQQGNNGQMQHQRLQASASLPSTPLSSQQVRRRYLIFNPV